jgi:outer membrane protein assembly factor BamD (BamD/ComL family)
MQVTGLVLLVVLAAPAGEAPETEAEGTPPPAWLSADGRESGAEAASPEAAETRARLLAAEGSFAAASRAYERLARRWPGEGRAERALLEAARAALAAAEYDRAMKLVAEMRSRWPDGDTAADRDRTELEVGERRLEAAGAPGASAQVVRGEAEAAYRVFAGILRRDRAGPIVERATLGRARAQQLLGKPNRAIRTLEVFLREFPASDLAPAAWRELAELRSGRVRNRAPEREVLAEAAEQIRIAESFAEKSGNRDAAEKRAIEETWRAIAERQAELKIEEARLYLRMRRPAAAEYVLRSVLRKYGETPSAARAAELLEELTAE